MVKADLRPAKNLDAVLAHELSAYLESILRAEASHQRPLISRRLSLQVREARRGNPLDCFVAALVAMAVCLSRDVGLKRET